LLGTLLIWGIVAIDAWYLWPTQLGGDTSIVVVSGKSMEPTYFGGDLVIARKMQPSIGDVIIYAPEGLGGSQIVHRIIGGNADEGWQMQGDNNSFIDPFNPKGEEVKGVVLVHYSNFGRVTVLLLNPMVWAFVLLAAMVLMLWYTGDDCDDRDDDDEDQDQGEDAGDGDPEPEAEEELDLIDRVVEGTEAALARMVASGAAAGAAAMTKLTRHSPSPRHAAPVARHAAPRSLLAAPAYLRGFAVLGVLLLSGLWASPASASGLTINTSGGVGSMTYSKCTTQSLNVTPSGTPTNGSYSAVEVSGFQAPCIGSPAQVYLYSSSGALLASGSVSSTTATTVFTTAGAYQGDSVSAAVVKMDGWPFFATWTPPPPPLAPITCESLNPNGKPTGQGCTVSYAYEVVSFNPWPNVSAYGINFTVSTGASDWRIRIDFSDTSAFPGWTPTYVGTNGNPQTGSCTGPVFTGTKNTTWGSDSGYLQARNDGGTYGTQLCP
jgi:signal peptidase